MGKISEAALARGVGVDVRTLRKYAPKWKLKPVKVIKREIRYYADTEISRLRALIPGSRERGRRLVEE